MQASSNIPLKKNSANFLNNGDNVPSNEGTQYSGMRSGDVLFGSTQTAEKQEAAAEAGITSSPLYCGCSSDGRVDLPQGKGPKSWDKGYAVGSSPTIHSNTKEK